MATSPNLTADDSLFARESYSEQVQDLLKVQKAAQKISSILDLDELIEKIVNDVARSFGCVESSVYLHHEDRQEMVLASTCGCTVNKKGLTLKIGKQGMVGYVGVTQQMRYAPDVRLDPYYISCEPTTQSEVAIPLMVERELVGVFTASHPALDAFPPEQLRILQSLCSHVAVAVQNARRFKQVRQEHERMHREAQEARTIQEALLPKSSPYIPGFAVSGVSLPAGAVGGDWYDFIPLEDGRWGLVLADVAGKGTAAALLMSATRGMMRSLAETACAPGEVLGKLNRLLMDDFPHGRFVTMLYAVLDPRDRTLTFANAGHLPPLLVEGTASRFLQTETGIPLGLSFGSFSEVEVRLPVGARLIFYSDGITEAANLQDEEFGRERLRNHALTDGLSPESILDAVRAHVDGACLQDDATAILVRA